MKKSLHTKTIYKVNLMTALQIAHDTNYQGVELVASNLCDYLLQGNTGNDLKKALDKYNLEPRCINDICNVDIEDLDLQKQILKEAYHLSSVAKDIGCKVIQLVPLCSLEHKNFDDIIKITGDNIRAIADVGAQFGVGFQLEPVAWSPIHSLDKSLKLLNYVERENVRMVIDFWHLWAGGETTPDDVAKLDKNMIYNIHFCDGLNQRRGTKWDETILRGVLPEEGHIPLKEWVDAVKATGYDDFWSCELISAKHWEQNAFEVAKSMNDFMDKYI